MCASLCLTLFLAEEKCEKSMVLIKDGSSEHDAHISGISNFDLLKAFGYVERDVKSEFISERTYFTSYVRNKENKK